MDQMSSKAPKSEGTTRKNIHISVSKKTSIGRRPSLGGMNKSKKLSFKSYRGQGR